MANRSRRRRSAWGSITELDAGERYRIRYWAETPNGYRRKSETVRGTRKDAERRRAELMLEHSEDAPCPTVGAVWERWYLPAQERRIESGDMAEQTLKVYKSVWKNHAGPRWKDVPCDQVRPLHVQQWLDTLGHSEAKTSMQLLRPMTDFAVRYGSIQTNPFRERYIMPTKKTVTRRDDGVWSLEELGKVWQQVIGEWFEAAFLLAAFGGLRVGESLGVMGTDVSAMDVNGQRLAIVRVQRQVMNQGGAVSDELKNRQSNRTVVIPGRAGARLLALAAENPGFLSGDGLGSNNDQRRLWRSWDAAMKKMDTSLQHPFRNLRNSWETNSRWTLRLPPHITEPLMGHAGHDVTGAYYDRPRVEMYADAVSEAYAERQYDAGWTWAS